MQSNTANVSSGDTSPISNFSKCHEGILSHLQALGELPALLEPALRAREIAEQTLQFFRPAVFDHHIEEEKDLFPAVLAAAAQPDERAKVQAMINSLTADHRVIEAIWRELEPQLQKVAHGQLSSIDVASVERLVGQYKAHAHLEEEQFLPLAETILGRKDPKMAELGLALHMRHVVRAARRGLRGS
ncbi:MAG: hemerythrin domain-containing protein [Burkholderiaceae bacterium]